MNNAFCYVCYRKIIETYPNPDDEQEEIYVCANGHHEHSCRFMKTIKVTQNGNNVEFFAPDKVVFEDLIEKVSGSAMMFHRQWDWFTNDLKVTISGNKDDDYGISNIIGALLIKYNVER